MTFKFLAHKPEGLDYILLRKRKSSFGGNKNRSWGNEPAWGTKPDGQGVEPYTAPDTLRKSTKVVRRQQ